MTKLVLGTMILIYLESASAVEFEKLGTAISKALGTKQAFQKNVQVDGKETAVFYSKDKSGKPLKLAVVQKGVYEPNCSHTWVVAIDPKKTTVEQIRVVEMSCPHAFPTNKPNFLDQFKGRGPASVGKMKEEIQTIAKATGSCDLTTDAVKKSIKAATAFTKGS